jgi:4-hydroxymandelate oxidase
VLTVDLLPGAVPVPPRPRPALWEASAARAEPVKAFTATTLDDLAWLCGEARLPVLVKGVLRGDDALSCVEAGASGLIVSNHGGNQLDTIIPSADALGEVVEACAGRADILVDGGLRTGTAILKALALGAWAVLVGRPTSYALAAGGAEAVAAMLAMLKDELARAMALCGAGTIEALDPSLVKVPAL